ncbi:MAG: hypothetical protein ABFE13_26635 [Phycisphaerales bacterium]
MEWKKVILVLVMAFGATEVVCADMVYVSGQNDRGPVPAVILDHAGEQPLPVSGVFSYSAMADLGSLSVEFLPAVKPEAGDAGEPQPVCVLVDRQDSLGLCLYALLGLGLCKSVPWVKRVSLGVVPGWYHDGGPFQVGHSSAASPDCLDSALVCFSQPGVAAKTLLPRRYRRVIVSLWRESQITSAILASRGPPLRSS